MSSDDDSHPSPSKFLDGVQEIPLGDHVQAQRRLIQNQDLGTRQHGRDQSQFLLSSPGPVPDRLIHVLDQG